MDVLDRLSSVIDELAALDARGLADQEAVLALHRQRSRLNAVLARALAACEADGGWAADGSTTVAGWLAGHTRSPRNTAKRDVALGRGLRHMEKVDGAWSDGDLCDAHVSLLVAAQARNPEAFARDEEVLVNEAKRLSFSAFRRLMTYWGQLADPDGDDDQVERDRDARKLHLSESFGGCWHLDGFLDPTNGAIVANELSRLEKQLFEDDWKQARARVGAAARASDLRRTAAQRRADALVEMAMRSRSMPSGSRRPEPLFTVLVNYETLVGRICELANGTVVSPAALVRYLDAAWIERVVFESPSRVIDVGVKQRLFTGGTRRAVQVRDQWCYHPTCEVPAEDCEIDHVLPFSQGGPTTADNGRPACDFHNRKRRDLP